MQAIQNVFHTSLFRINNLLETCWLRFSQTERAQPKKILSFGCSIGDEVGSIRAFFPDAKIFGCESDPRLLEISRLTFQHDRDLTFFSSTFEDIAAHGPYDLIVASAVLCRNPAPANYGAAFSFAQFEDVLGRFDQSLSVGGLLILSNAGYRFSDSDLSIGYRALQSDIIPSNGFVDVFYKDASPYLKQERSYGIPIYSRHGNYAARDDEDIANCIFEKVIDGGDTRPVQLFVRPVPASLEAHYTFVRRNVDYSPIPVTYDALVVEKTITLLRFEDGTSAGYSISTSWTSFGSDTVYQRKSPILQQPLVPSAERILDGRPRPSDGATGRRA